MQSRRPLVFDNLEWSYEMLALGIVGGILAGIGVVIILFMLTAPAFVALGLFVNKPTTERSGIHFFTLIEPGIVKFVVRGDTIVRAVAFTSGKKFARVGPPEAESHWELVVGEPQKPTTYVSFWPIRLWAKYVYATSGGVFTGVWPFQKVREYKLERTSVIRDEHTDEIIDGEKADDNIRLKVVVDYSDHNRLKRFQYAVNIIGAETKDKIPVDTLLVLECETTNPFRSAFGIDRWDLALTNFATDMVAQKQRTLTLDQILTAKTTAGAQVIQKAILKSPYPKAEIGIEVFTVRILKMEPRVTEAEKLKIRAEAFAIQQAKATVIDGKAQADNLRALNLASAEGGGFALATLEAQTRIKTAEAAGKGGVVIMGAAATPVDPILIAQLKELKELNEAQAKGS